uniref:Malic_M domain-containing protein n=1 Tax=Angiostrongylus cantonensis TaxID=6313 RepID=A0A0K0CWM6_ANGCA
LISRLYFNHLIKGRVLFASGSPFQKIEYKGKTFKPSQGNNSYIFPGVGLAAVLWKAKKIPDNVFIIAAKACASMVTIESLEKFGRIYPPLQDIPELSVKIAMEACDYFYKENLATLHPRPENVEMYVRHQIYSTSYDDVVSEAYKWPEKDSEQGYHNVPKLQRYSLDDDD